MRELDSSQEIYVVPQSLKIDKNDNSLYEDLKIGLEQAIEMEKNFQEKEVYCHDR